MTDTREATPRPWRVEEGTALIWGRCDHEDNSSHGMGYPVTECLVIPCSKWAAGPSYDEGEANAALIVRAVNNFDEVVEKLWALVNAKAISGVREMVAGWNGENRPDGPYAERHPFRLGATLPKTNCGRVYELDEAMQAARALLAKLEASHGSA